MFVDARSARAQARFQRGTKRFVLLRGNGGLGGRAAVSSAA
ncbi:hypothetical protein AKJ09_06819 [Labilithrix luteola]|uniref:Uncharacterized protein n=1 Tax=Labilithrix luteola TaxID=1391654 RepID=A0A0K1Q2W3_9BACT|nr:hypothetical protein AKJ09_06819 [Labilithrix luteola]